MKGLALILALTISATCYSQGENFQSSSSGQAPLTSAEPSATIQQQNSVASQAHSDANGTVATQESAEPEVSKYIQECNSGKADSCLMLVEGFMREDNSQEAKKYAEKGCDLNNGLACGVMGIIAVTAGNNPKDSLNEASVYFEKGCRLGDPTSCKTLADIYKSGIVGEYPKEKITELYRRSCDIGLQAGCKALEHFEEQPDTTPNGQNKD